LRARLAWSMVGLSAAWMALVYGADVHLRWALGHHGFPFGPHLYLLDHRRAPGQARVDGPAAGTSGGHRGAAPDLHRRQGVDPVPRRPGGPGPARRDLASHGLPGLRRLHPYSAAGLRPGG